MKTISKSSLMFLGFFLLTNLASAQSDEASICEALTLDALESAEKVGKYKGGMLVMKTLAESNYYGAADGLVIMKENYEAAKRKNEEDKLQLFSNCF